MLSADRSAVSIARALPADPQQVGACRHPVPVLGEPLDLAAGIERPEEGLGERQAGRDDRLAAVHHPAEPRLGRDHRRRRDVAPLAQILGEGRADEGVEVETGECETGHRNSMFVMLNSFQHPVSSSCAGGGLDPETSSG